MASLRSRFSGKVTRLIVATVLIGALLTGTGLAFAADPPSGAANEGRRPPAEVIEKMKLVAENEKRLRDLGAQTRELANAIRLKIKELRAAGTQIPEDVQEAIKQSRQAIKEGKKNLRNAVGKMKTEQRALREDVKTQNWAGALEHLENILALQESVLEEGARVVAQLQHVLKLLKALG
jgi:hypothetical protein